MILPQEMVALFLFREFGKEIQRVPSVLKAENNMAQMSQTRFYLDTRGSLTHEQLSYCMYCRLGRKEEILKERSVQE